MKIKTTTLLLLSAAFSVVAQTPGYTPSSIYDDFATDEEYSDPNAPDPEFPDGVYWWGKEELTQDDNECIAANKYVLDRSGNGKLSVTTSQGNNCWEPFGISTVLDLSNNATFELSLTNNSDTAIYIDIYIVDEDGEIINSDAQGNNFNLLSVGPGQTEILSGDFANGQHKEWPGPTFSQNLDLSKIVEIDFTIVNASQPESNDWGPEPISDLNISLNYLKVGVDGPSNDSYILKGESYVAYPNPVTEDMVYFSKTLKNLKVFSSAGALLIQENNVNSLDLSNLSAGIYFLHSDNGITKLIKQ